MNFLVLLLVVLYAARAETQDFVCGFRPPPESEGASKAVQGTGDVVEQEMDAYYRSGTIHPVIVFGKFKDQDAPVNLSDPLLDREGLATQRVEDLLDIEHKGSIAHYFFEMSNETLTLAAPPGGINTNWHDSERESVEEYIGPIVLRVPNKTL